MKALYKPVGIVAGIIGAKLGKRAFEALWAKFDADEPPNVTRRDASIGKVVGAAVLEGAAKSGTKAATERVTAHSFHYLFGFWPGAEDDAQSEKNGREP